MSAFMNENGGCIAVFPPGRPDTIKHDTFALHDWRLVSREWVDASYFGGTLDRPAIVNKDAVGWQETWYCKIGRASCRERVSFGV